LHVVGEQVMMQAVVVEQIGKVFGILNKNSWAEYGYLWDAEMQQHVSEIRLTYQHE